MRKYNIHLISFFIITFIFIRASYSFEKETIFLAKSISDSITQSGKKTVAVVDFSDLGGNINELGRFFAEELSIQISKTSRNFVLIDRTHLKTLLSEHKLSMSGLVDPTTVKKLGQLIGVDAIITGTVTPLGNRYRISCKIISTDTAKIIAAESTNITKSNEMENLWNNDINSGYSNKQDHETKLHRKSIKIDQYKIELLSCSLYEYNIDVEIMLTNIGDDILAFLRPRHAYEHLTLIDNLGENYVFQKIMVGGINIGEWAGPSTLFSNVPIRIRYSFKKQNLKKITSIKKLNIIFTPVIMADNKLNKENNINVRFSDIPLK